MPVTVAAQLLGDASFMARRSRPRRSLPTVPWRWLVLGGCPTRFSAAPSSSERGGEVRVKKSWRIAAEFTLLSDRRYGNALRPWAADEVETMAEARPEMPSGIEDRDADVWEPLLAIADAVGGDWPVRA